MTFNPSKESLLIKQHSDFSALILKRLKPENWPFDFKDLPKGSVLVGGAVRDVLLNRVEIKPDLDLVVPSNAINLSKKLAYKLEGKAIVLDEERDISRLVVSDWKIDIASQFRRDITQDLLRRDFTMNAIAVTLEENPQIIDPAGGLKDIKRKKLVAISQENLVDDPLRMLRAFRLMADRNLLIEEKTLIWINLHSHLLQKVSPERIQSELDQLINANGADEALISLETSGLLKPWQEKNDSHFEKHSCPSLSNAKEMKANEILFSLPLARLTYLISDEGLINLCFSKKQRQRCKLLRFWKNRNDGFGFTKLTEKERLQLHQDLEEDLPALILELSQQHQIVWLSRWRDPNDPLFHPCSPLDGNYLQKTLKLPSGPALGQLMRHLCHERAFGRLQNNKEALKSASDWIRASRNFPYCD